MFIIQRLRDSLFSPKQIINYKDDNFFKVLTMFLLLVILLVLPSTLSISTKKYLSYNDELELKKVISGEVIPFQIKNGKLLNDNDNDNFIYQKDIDGYIKLVVSNSSDLNLGTNLVILIGTDGVYLTNQILKLQLLTYEDHPSLNNTDLKELGNVNSPQWNNVLTVIRASYQEFMEFYRPVMITANVISAIGILLFMSLVIAFFQHFTLKGLIEFRKFWKLVIYLFTPYVVLETIFTLFGVNLVYLSFIVTAVYTIILSRQIQTNSIRRI